jgi:hypothetical protein
MKLLVAICLCLNCSWLWSQKSYSKQAILADIDYLYAALKQNHPGTYRFHSVAQFDSLRNEMEKEIPVSMEKNQAYFTIRKFLAFVCDAHTQMVNMPADKDKRTLSAEFEINNHSLFLKRSRFDSTLNNLKVVSINGISSKAILKEYSAVVSADELKSSFKEAVTAYKLPAVMKTFYNMRDTLRFILETETQERIRLNMVFDEKNILKPNVPPQSKNILAQSNALIAFKNRDSNVVIQLTKFQNSKYKSFYAKVFEYLEHNKVDTLFIDLRNNTGGNFYHAYHLLNYICDDTLALTFSRKTHQGSRYFKDFQKGMRIFGFFHREISNGGKIEKKNGFKFSTNYFYPIVKHHFKGKVVVLTNGLSISSSTIVAYYLKHKASATIMGEPGGGEFGNCGGAFPKIKLPNTKMKINFPSYWMDYHLKKSITNYE